MIVSELLKPHMPEGTKMKLDDFMLQSKAERDDAAKARLIASLSAMAAGAERKQRRAKR